MIKTLARNNLKAVALALLFVAACMPKGVGVKDPSFAYDDDEDEAPAAEVAKPAVALAADGAAVLPAVPSANLAALDEKAKLKMKDAQAKVNDAILILKNTDLGTTNEVDDVRKQLEDVMDKMRKITDK